MTGTGPGRIESADYYDPLKYCSADEPVDEPAVALSVEVTENVIAKVDAGARLFYALYHHRDIVELIGSKHWTPGLNKAYLAAQNAYLGK